MTFDETISEFVAYLQREKTGRTYETYRRKILVFQEYIVQAVDMTDTNYERLLERLTNEDFLNSIKYYVKTSCLEYKSTTDGFWAALKTFFTYLGETHNLQNEWFNNQDKNKCLKRDYDILTLSLKLNAKETIYPPDRLQYQALVALCNKHLAVRDSERLLSSLFSGLYTNYISSLIVQFTLLYGCKNSTIDGLKITDYDPALHIMTINRYHVRLPNSLAFHMQWYVQELRPSIVRDAPTTRLFVDLTGGGIENGKKYAVLKPIIGNVKAASISKYAIIQMIQGRLSAHMIMEFTGYSHDVYNHCVELVEEESGITLAKDKSRVMDSALRLTSTFDEL